MTRKQILSIAAVIGVIALIAVAYAVFRKPAAPSGPLTAPTLAAAPATTAPTAAAIPTTPPTAEPTAAANPTSAPPEPTASPTPEPTPVPAQPVVFEIVSAESEATFSLGEMLQGSPNTVVGATNQVAGQMAVDFNNPQATQLGEIVVNARTLVTDNEFRNRAISNQILDTNQYEFITFQPTELIGLPAGVAIGDSIDFQVAGQLTIRDVTQPVTFAVNLNLISETQLTGSAQATVMRADFGLVIPQVRGVANVDEAVVLTLTFVVAPVQG